MADWFRTLDFNSAAQGLNPALETPDNFLGPISIFSRSLSFQLMVIIDADLVICFTKL